jgi:cell division protein FtsW (lipid II flippase)
VTIGTYERGGSTRRSLWIFGCGSLVAVLAGAVIVAQAGAGPLGGVRNLTAWVVGGLLALAVARRPLSARAGWAIAGAAVAGLVATFVNESQDGVHRWWDLGALHVNAAALLLPATIVALARPGKPLAAVSAVAVALGALLLAQPDASQATAFAIAMSAALFAKDEQPRLRWLTVAALAALAGLSWLRPDPLEPVPEVERIVQLGWQVAPAATVLGVLGLIATALAPLAARRPAAAALSAYIAVAALAPAVGAYPLPLMGIGMSSVLGLWLGVGLLAGGNGSSGQT